MLLYLLPVYDPLNYEITYKLLSLLVLMSENTYTKVKEFT